MKASHGGRGAAVAAFGSWMIQPRLDEDLVWKIDSEFVWCSTDSLFGLRFGLLRLLISYSFASFASIF
jgi:hypothetical protein